MLTGPFGGTAGAAADGATGNMRFSSIVTIDRSNYNPINGSSIDLI